MADPAIPSTRSLSPEGILKAGAILTRAGTFYYLRSELGLEGDGVIKIERSLETLAHPTTLQTLRDAPITSGHPPNGVTAENFRKLVVGYVAGEPKLAGDVVIADVIIGDKQAQTDLENGPELP